MIVYCGLRHFYIRNFEPPLIAGSQTDAYYILTHIKEVWDFSPKLKDHGFTNQAKGRAVLHLDKPIIKVDIDLNNFATFAKRWHDFSRQYTHELEIEYPHSWYLRFEQPAIFRQFILDFSASLHQEEGGGIWGAGNSKLVAKLAAHNLTGHERVVLPEQTEDFLNKLPLHRLHLPELTNLEKLGVKTIGELGKIPLVELVSQFGSRASSLQKLGKGQDLVPFQTEHTQEYSWSLDCTTLEEFLRPLDPQELKPYLQEGINTLATTLQEKHKVAGEIRVEAILASGASFQEKRQIKGATDDAKRLKLVLESLLPLETIAQISIVLGNLSASPLAQLNMFWDPQAPQLCERELPAQVGIELSRRERLLILWEEYFS
ncbi:MAG: hypothetical protein GX971_11405 [Firmicutes bacterium]|nr:hypothetical protein [Bacillota bacterium]